MNKEKINGILFDMDGVILDSMPFHVRAWMDAFSEHGLDAEEEIFYLYEGAIEPDVACRLFSKNGHNVTIEEFNEILSRQREIFINRYSNLVRPFPGVHEILNRLKEAGLRLAMVTSSHTGVLEAVLSKELAQIFDHIVTGDQVSRRKPHPDPYLVGLQGLGIGDPARSMAVENAPSGINSAKAAGLSCVAITTTLPKEELSHADFIIRDHAELLPLALSKARIRG